MSIGWSFIWCLPVVTGSADDGTMLNSHIENDAWGTVSPIGETPAKIST